MLGEIRCPSPLGLKGFVPHALTNESKIFQIVKRKTQQWLSCLVIPAQYFMVLWKLLQVSYCVAVSVLLSVFGILCVTSIGDDYFCNIKKHPPPPQLNDAAFFLWHFFWLTSFFVCKLPYLITSTIWQSVKNYPYSLTLIGRFQRIYQSSVSLTLQVLFFSIRYPNAGKCAPVCLLQYD